jgi:flagellar protein FlaG
MSVASVGSGLVTRVEIPREVYREGVAQRPHSQVPILRADSAIKPQVINSTAADLEKISLVFDKKLQFVVDHASNQVIVKVIDKETDKVIKELPPEELQRLYNNLKETIGFLFDERV